MPLTLSGTNGVQDNSGAFVQSSTIATTSGTSIDFTSIPSWVKRITLNFNNVSFSGTGEKMIQLGTSSGITSTGYISRCFRYYSAAAANTGTTSGFVFAVGYSSADNYIGNIYINSMGSNLWQISGLLVDASNTNMSGGTVTLSGTLDRVRITTVLGSETFDGGSINILYQ